MLETEIKTKFIEARKKQDKILKTAYELVVASILNEEKSGKYSADTELPDEVVQSLVLKNIKAFKETQSFYKPEDTKYQELEFQINELSQYLPEEITEDTVKDIIKNFIESGETNLGKIIGATIKKVGNSFDKSKVSGLVKEMLSK